mmetsp:Transcript_137998/g.428889  ORF Transcript_137998/g.428889 Transcript_137998/m.428889 type:complete len:405 (-) Transcript_137998:63-1277(-)|eukprot:CAMPEP_0204598898 /NCGR_PEP_ID=MMETSP0661-20131031/54546_1 /ASSEMBLY_ACC=CAM_ASM_000606 /TAXON_ID=109239 /ORGANISM="Alexandrium margalefi, Strain AMGDE01CS-322" /LENGTH=404 /DNA_ID=CAMNT_0051609607 /DNA_START=68 /DNA_END=1282 /DNA_ORIENTATION=-
MSGASESVPDIFTVDGIESEPGLNGTYLRNGRFRGGKAQWMKPGTRCYIRWIRDRWELYVSHHPSGTTYFFHAEESVLPPASGWTPTECALPCEVPQVTPCESVAVAPPSADLQFAAPHPPPLLLWWNSTCPFVQRVSIALLEMGVHVHKREADIHGSHEDVAFVAAFRRACPDRARRPAIPVLEHRRDEAGARGAVTLIESQVIVEYLDDTFGSAGEQLVPVCAAERARARLFLLLVERVLLPCEADLLAARTQDDYAAALGRLDDALVAIEAGLRMHGDSAGPYLAGHHFGFVEVNCAPFLQRLATLMPRFRSFSLMERAGTLPRTLSWINAMLDRPSVVNTYDLEAVAEVKSRAVATLEKAESFSQRRASAMAVLQAKFGGSQVPAASELAESDSVKKEQW